ncbi:MAG: alpha/beta fold hydrolase, partial [Steroidobacteraceae bacterium]
MNASVEAVPSSHRAHATPVSAPDMVVREGILDVSGEVSLYHGGRLCGIRIAWRLAGPANAPVVCALGGISANRRVFAIEDPREGWWSEVAGPGRALAADRFRVLSFDYLGGSADTTGPTTNAVAPLSLVAATGSAPGAAGAPTAPTSFPNISTYDQAELLVRLLNNLGLKSLRAIAGGSYGGMVALAFG